MSEMAKTVVFVAVAAASLLLGFVMKPSGDTFDVEEIIGERLNQFEVEDPKRLKIVKFDQGTASTREFEVATENDRWTIPSKQGYPADATKQMAEAATCLIDRQILKVAATSASEHQELGVVDPSTSNLGSSSEGVGIRVTMTNANDEELVDMIIGKAVKDAQGQRFVRNANQDAVYVVELNPEKLSTQFQDWIEDDLLQLNPMDIRRVEIKDYTAALQRVIADGRIQMQVSWDRRSEVALRYNNSDSKWTTESLRQFDAEKQEFADYVIAEDEELNEDNLRELRNGLDELLLVDVERKPEGLSADLKAGGDFLNNEEATDSLINRGFAPLQPDENSDAEILSSEGEVICTLDDGVEYVLRFGNLKMDGEAAVETSPAADDKAETDSSDGIHRYLFLMARFNDGIVEKPELDELPALPEGAEGEPASASEGEEENEEALEDDTSDEVKKIIAERKSIETENQRRLDEYQEKIESGKERVQELNERFGDWYYVISNSVYEQIHLSLDKVTRKKEKEEGEENADSDAGSGNSLPGLPNLPVGNAEGK